MSIFQIIAVCFGLFMMYLVGIHQKKRVLNSAESALWFGIWILFISLAFFPETLKGMVDLLHFDRVFDLLIVMALMVLTVVVFSSYIKQRQIELRIEEVVRRQAIKSTKIAKVAKSSRAKARR